MWWGKGNGGLGGGDGGGLAHDYVCIHFGFDKILVPVKLQHPFNSCSIWVMYRST